MPIGWYKGKTRNGQFLLGATKIEYATVLFYYIYFINMTLVKVIPRIVQIFDNL